MAYGTQPGAHHQQSRKTVSLSGLSGNEMWRQVSTWSTVEHITIGAWADSAVGIYTFSSLQAHWLRPSMSIYSSSTWSLARLRLDLEICVCIYYLLSKYGAKSEIFQTWNLHLVSSKTCSTFPPEDLSYMSQTFGGALPQIHSNICRASFPASLLLVPQNWKQKWTMLSGNCICGQRKD